MTKLNGSETSYLSKMSIGPSLPKSHKLGKIKTGSRPDIGQFITKEQGTVAFYKTDETRFRCAQVLQFLKKSDKIFLLKKKNSQRKITCHRAQTWKKRLKEDNTGVWENISIILYIFLNGDLFFTSDARVRLRIWLASRGGTPRRAIWFLRAINSSFDFNVVC